MEEKAVYISKITANNVRNLSGLVIDISQEKRSHLLLTGKNGSGKTTLLNEINIFLNSVSAGKYDRYEENIKNRLVFKERLKKNTDQGGLYSDALSKVERFIGSFGGVVIEFSDPTELSKNVEKGTFVIAFFDAKRVAVLDVPTGINKVNLKPKYNANERINSKFLQYIVNLKAEMSFAREDNEKDRVLEIENWFKNFENRLREILGDSQLTLVFDRKNYNFLIHSSGKLPHTLTQLSDGQSAILSILTEIILRMESLGSLGSLGYDIQGVVLIDEIETHLHVELQKMILPFLIEFFPNIQFIVTTHSPFVLSSVSNAVVCDLETGERLEDLSSYSYDALIESYFLSDQYSSALKAKVDLYENLSNRERTTAENSEYEKLEIYFSKLPMNNSPELKVKLQQIQLARLSGNEGK